MSLPHVMTPLSFCFCAPSRVLTGQILLVVIQAAHIAEWVQKPVRLTSEPWVSTKLWWHLSDRPPKSLQAHASQAGAGGFDYLGSSAPPQMFSPPRELMESFLSFRDTDTSAQPHPGSDQFIVPHQHLTNKMIPPGKLPENILKLKGDQNQSPQFKSISSLDQSSPMELEEPAQPSEPLEEVGSGPGSQPEVLVTPAELPEEAMPPTEQAPPLQAAESAVENVVETPPIHQVTFQPTQREEHHYLLPHAVFRPVDVALTITSEPTKEMESSLTQQESPVHPLEYIGEVEPFLSEQEQPAEPSELEIPTQSSEHALTQREQPTLSSEYHEVTVSPSMVKRSALVQPTESPKGMVAQSSAHFEVTALVHDQSQHPSSEATQKTTGSTVPTTTSPPPTHREVTLSPPNQVQTQQPNPTQVTTQSSHTESSTTPQPVTVVSHSPPVTEVTSQHPNSETIEPEVPTATASSSYPEMILPSPEQFQTQQIPSEVTLQPMDVEYTITPNAANSNTERKLIIKMKQNASISTNLCDLCLCENGALLCIHLSPMRRLHQVPVPRPNTYNGTLTIL